MDALLRIRHFAMSKHGLHRVLLRNEVVLMCDSYGDYYDPETGQIYTPLYDEEGMLIGFTECYYKYTF